MTRQLTESMIFVPRGQQVDIKPQRQALSFVYLFIAQIFFNHRDNRGRDRMVVVFITDGAISTYRLSPINL
jgi:hypothetical protein